MDILPLADSTLDEVMQLRPVTFHWRKPADDGMKGEQIGLIAQDVKKILPSAVLVQNDAGRTEGIKYDQLIPVLAKALQEQQQEILSLKKGRARDADAIAVLQAANGALVAASQRLQSSNATMEARLDRIEATLKTKGLRQAMEKPAADARLN